MEMLVSGILCPIASSKIPKIVKLTTLLILGICLQVAAKTNAQRITLSVNSVSIQTVFKQIEKQTGYVFFYRDNEIAKARPVSISVKDADLREALDEIFRNQPLSYEIEDKTIFVSNVQNPKKTVTAVIDTAIQQPVFIHVSGKVRDENGKALQGASVVIQGTKLGTTTNARGEFSIDVPENSSRLLAISFIGTQGRLIKISAQTGSLDITLAALTAQQQEVLLMGIVTKNKEAFTGAANSYSGAQLNGINNFNVLQSLSTLDPSFIITDNIQAGSNPNVQPSVEVRGKSSLDFRTVKNQYTTDPNQPLFVLDGFEVSLQTVIDLDPNRIETLVLLKDAASTALYGAKASNGVVVIETKKPRPGKLQLTYNADLGLQAPDLTSYNLMNAKEKLTYEKLAGFYGNLTTQSNYSTGIYPFQYSLDSLYYARWARAQEGVNTYWLSVPLQLGFSHSHSLLAEGGDNLVRYALGARYKQQDGVMKGSGRNDWETSFNLNYRPKKFNFSNILLVNGSKADDSPYGSFSNFAQANPYYKERNPDGTVSRLLDSVQNAQGNAQVVPNPLYNALLNNISETKDFGFQENVQLSYAVFRGAELKAGGMVNVDKSEQNVFLPAERSDFISVPIYQKGSQTTAVVNNDGYQGFFQFGFGRIYGGKHEVSATARADVQQSTSTSYAATTVGFPYGSNGNPEFSYNYQPYSKPTASNTTFRRNSFLALGSYTYDRRFIFDWTVRYDGSSVFGSNKTYTPFWSTGVGWNLQNEPWVRRTRVFNTLRVKYNIGYTGNQSFGTIYDATVYNFLNGLNGRGQGVQVGDVGNQNLAWQKTLQSNLGVDFSLYNTRLTGYVNFFDKYTSPLIIPVTLPTSTGMSGYPMNVGHLDNKGVEANIKYYLIRKVKKRIAWAIGVTGISQYAKFGGLKSSLASLNTEQYQTASLNRYYDGYSPDDLWAVRSLGIDPATGNEEFLKVNGKRTFAYDPTDIVKVGNARPILIGVINNDFTYKGFTLGLYFRYTLKGDLFNTDLYDKVENISQAALAYNIDKRALYDRWQKPGDVAQFKGITNFSNTPMSSRFVQQENTISAESLNLSYDFGTSNWLKTMRLKNLRVTGYTNQLFRVSTVKAERGTDYPFARSYSAKIAATF